MKKEIIINSTLNEVRIAITENGKLAELFIELPDKERSIGNIYLGKVSKIVQGINAAFINIGQGQDAFLHFSDVDESLENVIIDEDDEAVIDEDQKSTKDTKHITDGKKLKGSAAVALRKKQYVKDGDSNGKQVTFQTKRHGQLHINLEPGQDVIVQTVREAYSSKGVKVTTKIGIPGRYLVLLPFDNLVGVSRKISSFNERRRLRKLARKALPEGYGCIIRTAAQNKIEVELEKDIESLIKIWSDAELKVKKAKEPMLLYQDLHIATSVVRDLFTKDVTRVAIDSKKLYKDITSYLKWTSPELLDKVELFTDKKPILEAFGVEKEIEQTYKRKIFLQSGGSIIFDQTEAMWVIDVNSGRSISEDKQELNALKTNLEALREIARQIRLRDIGGIILIDFIDLDKEKYKKRLYTEMKKELARDRTKTVVYPVTQLTLMQITRQRANQDIAEKLSETCPTCQGTGRITSKGVLNTAIERWLKNFRADSREFRLILIVHPHMASYLAEGTISRLSRLMIKYFVKIKVQQSNLIRIDQFQFFSQRQQKDITQEFL